MSMLAERKRKQKWSLNPRGNDWSKDGNKYGLRLMERMGWKEGKGLGAKEDGATKHVHVSYKNDVKGIGFNESLESSFQQDNFSTLLNELNNTIITDELPVALKSLEEKSENSRARVHYKKFTRGKDLSRYSEKDLANILGRRKLKTNKHATKPETISDALSSQSPQFGVNTTTGGSMVEYFKNKLPQVISPLKTVRRESESETEVNHGFGFNISEANCTHVTSPPISKKRKHDDKYSREETPSMKKLKGKNLLVQNNGLINLAFDPLSRTVISTPKRVLEVISETDEQSPELITQVNRCIQDEEAKQEHSMTKQNGESEFYSDEHIKNSSLNTKVKKKKQRQMYGTSNPSFEVNNFETIQSTSDYVTENEGTNELMPKKFHKHAVDDSKANTISNSSEIKTKRKNVSKHKDNPNLHVEANTIDVIGSLENDKSKRKRRNYELSRNCITDDKTNFNSNDISGCFDNPGFAATDTIEKMSPNYNLYEVKTKKKLKKYGKGVENPCFEDACSSQLMPNDNGTVENITEFEVKVKNKEKKYRSGVDKLDPPTDSTVLSNDTVENQSHIGQKMKRKKNKTSPGEYSISNETVDTLSMGKLRDKHRKKKLESENVCELSENCDIEVARNPEAERNLKNTKTSSATVNEESKVILNSGIDNPVFNLNGTLNVDDCDLILNITNEPVETKSPETKKGSKNIFSKFNMERNERTSSGDIAQREELCGTNTKMTKASSARHKKAKGRDNAAFNFTTNFVEESVNALAKSLEDCQAEVENGINESKIKKLHYEERMVGEAISLTGEDEPHPEGVIFRLKNASFSNKSPYWVKHNDLSVSYPKKSYKHLIKGDVIVGFRNTNLHNVNGYGKPLKKLHSVTM